MTASSPRAATLTDRERRVIAAIADALLPALQRDDDPGGLFAAGALALGSTDRVVALVESLPDPQDRRRLVALFAALDSRTVNLLLAGRFARITDLNTAEREAILKSWAFSRLPVRRAGFQALKRLCHIAHYCWPPNAANDGRHPAWTATGYPGPLPPPARTYEPLPVCRMDRDTTLECDAVVLGSGAGGGVAAGVLAECGKSVVVLERGPNPDPRAMTQIEGEMLGSLYLDGGTLMTQSGSMPILAGSCLGGGTVINYTTSFALPQPMREEWDAVSGLSLFTSARFAESLERVAARSAVATEWSPPGPRDTILERGLRQLGWHVDRLPRNVTGCKAGVECGFCGYGCRHGAKKSTDRTYLAAAAQAGARLVPHCHVDRILLSHGRAERVVATVLRPGAPAVRLTVRAPIVVVACGAVHTPAVLARSGIASPHLGGRLFLHPATAVLGIFEERVEPWSGALQTRYSDQFAHLDGQYGVKFETAPVHFALAASAFGWEGSRRAREDVARLAHTGLVGILLRDRHAGRIRVGRDGRPRAHYDVSRYDAAHVRRGIAAAAELLAAAGAREIVTLQTPPVRFCPGGSNWPARFLTEADARGYRRNRMSFVSFHQMGTAPLGRDPARGVADERGAVHGMTGVYVADGSAFPRSSGVNPMLTIMAIADHVARGICEQ
ncbi:MAG TPA: GMC family oxidoreductase N-terminal domain-containing protein [Gemmatimonadales bacterium]|nr:GMC family oxidoreductase N-terminal domain-containing protein [Gemmatimonadales bacterium]